MLGERFLGVRAQANPAWQPQAMHGVDDLGDPMGGEALAYMLGKAGPFGGIAEASVFADRSEDRSKGGPTEALPQEGAQDLEEIDGLDHLEGAAYQHGVGRAEGLQPIFEILEVDQRGGVIHHGPEYRQEHRVDRGLSLYGGSLQQSSADAELPSIGRGVGIEDEHQRRHFDPQRSMTAALELGQRPLETSGIVDGIGVHLQADFFGAFGGRGLRASDASGKQEGEAEQDERREGEGDARHAGHQREHEEQDRGHQEHRGLEPTQSGGGLVVAIVDAGDQHACGEAHEQCGDLGEEAVADREASVDLQALLP